MSENVDVAAIRADVDEVLATRRDEISKVVCECLADALKVPAQGISPTARLIEDLVMQSIDLLDVTFRLERAFRVKIPRGAIRRAVLGTAAANVEERGRLTPEGVKRLLVLMPELGTAHLPQSISVQDIADLYQVETLVRLVAWQLSLKSGAGGE